MRKYAERTQVAISRTREEIARLLTQWGCSGLQWTDDFKVGRAMLQFTWEHDDVQYLARFVITVPSEDKLRAQARHAVSGRFLPARFTQLQRDAGRREHRVLFNWIKAALNAVEEGIIEAERIFLPFLVGKDGRTIADVALPNMKKLVGHSAQALLPDLSVES